jgi:large subunit ribosomal protein L3
MGDKVRTMQNIQVIDVDKEKGLIIVKGSIPGSKGGYVYISDSIKKSIPANAPFPAAVKRCAGDAQIKAVENTEKKCDQINSEQFTHEASNEG